jgi:hypothetical protein
VHCSKLTLEPQVPKLPRLEYHGSNDTSVPYAPELQYVEQQCANGADIRFVTFQNASHASTAVQGFLGALQFVAESLNGTVTEVPCGSSTTMIAPGSNEAVELLGQSLSDEYDALVAQYAATQI